MKPRTFRRWRLCAVLIAALNLIEGRAQQTQPRRPSVESISIRHIGPAAVSDELIRGNLRLREGDPFSPVIVDDDIQNLHATGYFYNIRVIEEPGASGIKVTYAVQGKPVLTEVRLSGNTKYSNTKLLKKIKSKVGEPLDEQKLFADSQEIEKLYQKAGLQKTKVEYKPIINENLGRGTVTFEISEAAKIKIDDVRFEDAKAFKQKKLRHVVKTRRHWMFSWITGSGKLKDEVFEEDKEKLHDFYADHGYVDYNLKDVQIQPQSKTNHVDVNWIIEEGNQYHVGSVEFKGNEIFTQEDLVTKPVRINSRFGEKERPGLKQKEGSVFSPSELSRDTEALSDLYGSRGYVEAQIFAQKNANIEKGTIDLVHNIQEGDKSYVEKIEIKGNTKTKDKVIRRELALTPGEPFNMAKAKISKSRLEQMQYFEKVDTTTEPASISNRKNLVIGVEEKNTGNIAVGAGFSSIDNVVGFVEVSQGNFDLFNPPYFTGGGQKARLRAQFGSQRQDYIATFVEPWFLGRRLELTTDLYHRDLNYLSDNYSQRQTGGRLGLRRALPYNFEVGGSYTLESIGIRLGDTYRTTYPDSVILQEEGRRLVSKLGFTLGHDTRDSFTYATRGHRVEFSSEVAGGPLGGDTDYYNLELRGAKYFAPNNLLRLSGRKQDILEGHVLEIAGRAGVVEAYGSGDRGDANRVPLFDRYFLGGLYSLRGFKYRHVGPRDFTSKEPIGGGTYWFSSAEYTIPIIERLRFALFYDAGMVYQQPYSFSTIDRVTGKDFETGSFNDDWGVGLRLNLPIGPLRLDYGIPIHHGKDTGTSGRFQFGVGYSREF